jgi:hypothetical protein
MISKTDIQSYLQCPRKLWLEHNGEIAQSGKKASDGRREKDGEAVGALAREALGPHVIWPASSEDKAVAFTLARAELMARPGLPAVEFPLVFGDVYARADALLPLTSNQHALQETKASTFPLKDDKVTPGKPEPHHLDDVAIQAWTMAQAGLGMGRAELNLLDGQWRYPGAGDYSGIFKQYDVTDLIAQRVAMVPDWVAGARATLAAKVIPIAKIGKQCNKPHGCPFADTCKTLEPDPPKHPLTLLPDIGGKALAKKLTAAGYSSLLDPEPSLLVGCHPQKTELYRRIQTAHKQGKAILSPKAREVIDALPYPRYFLDFEGIDLPIPVWEGVRPYEQIPVQFSLHIQRAPAGPLEHVSFLDLSGADPSADCIAALLGAIEDDQGCILVYFATYEKGRLEELGKRHPAYAVAMAGLVERLVDLLPIVKEFYYHPVMEGSFSIKKVLKAMAPRLDYGNLDEVQEGVGAQVAYLEAAFGQGIAQSRKLDLARKLTLYCEQDTWAMVVIACFLSRRLTPPRPATDMSAISPAPRIAVAA